MKIEISVEPSKGNGMVDVVCDTHHDTGGTVMSLYLSSSQRVQLMTLREARALVATLKQAIELVESERGPSRNL